MADVPIPPQSTSRNLVSVPLLTMLLFMLAFTFVVTRLPRTVRDALDSGRIRLLHRVSAWSATLLLAVATAWLIGNALTIRDRASPTVVGAEAASADAVQLASWLAAGLCSVALIGIGSQCVSVGPRTPRAMTWVAGVCGLGAAYVVAMWTATLWV
jgi:hypothetical protein